MTDKKYALIVPMRTIVRILETSTGLIKRKQESWEPLCYPPLSAFFNGRC